MESLTTASPGKDSQYAPASGPQGPVASRLLILFGVAFLLVLATRAPFQPAHLYSFDNVNFALALHDFDPTRNQPQPPGYPLFVLEARILNVLLRDAKRTFDFLSILVSALAVGMLYLLGRRMLSHWMGLIAAALLFVNPPFWFSGLTSPLRPHLALIPIAVAYCCWRFLEGEDRHFYLSATLLGLGAGFRPELLLFLLPLWAWTLWHRQRLGWLLRGFLIIAAIVFAWAAVAVSQSGGLGRVLPAFSEYIFSQTQDTSLLLNAPESTLRRNIGRAIIWTGLGTLPWIWTLPFGWLARRQLPEGKRVLTFLALWFLPGFLFHLLVHIGDPDHAVSTIPALCLLGGLCLVSGEEYWGRIWSAELKLNFVFCFRAKKREYLERIWSAELKQIGIVVWIALVGNVVLFFGDFTVPQPTPGVQFRGLRSVSDAFSIGLYETSSRKVQWGGQMTQLAFKRIEKLKAESTRPLSIIWVRDGEPVWRKICFYFPDVTVYALDEQGDPGVPASMARIWLSNEVQAVYRGATPIQVPISKGGRLIWVMGAASVAPLSQIISLQAADPLYYTDLPPDFAGFRWGSFELLPQ